MWERFKKFNKEHETEIIAAAAFAGTFAATCFIIYKMNDGKDVARVSRKLYEDGGMDVAVILKNGRTMFWNWDPQAK